MQNPCRNADRTNTAGPVGRAQQTCATDATGCGRALEGAMDRIAGIVRMERRGRFAGCARRLAGGIRCATRPELRNT